MLLHYRHSRQSTGFEVWDFGPAPGTGRGVEALIICTRIPS